MARRPLSERLTAERERVAKAHERVRKLEAQERKTERAKDTRRKVLLGALVMEELERDTPMRSELERWLAERLPGYLIREHDRDVMAQFMDGGTLPVEADSEEKANESSRNSSGREPHS